MYDKECLYNQEWKTKDTNCSYYITNDIDNRYVECKEELCPIKHPELIGKCSSVGRAGRL